MKLDLSEIINNPGMRAKQKIETACPKDLGVDCTLPVKGELHLNNTGTLILLEGELSTEVKLECSLCLIDFTLPVEFSVQEEFRVEQVGDTLKALPMDEEDVFDALVSGGLLDVDELVRQNLLVALPIQPLCRPDCQGLCPTCGENLNVRKCQCPPAEPESPFHALADLLKDEEEKSA